MTHVRFFNPGKAYLKIKPEIDREMQRVLKAGDLILRKDVEVFEKNFARYVGTKYAVAVASGTDALILSLKAAGLKRGDRVLCPSYTFRATAEAIHHAGGVPVLYDLDGKLDLTDNPKFYVPAHIAGEVLLTKEIVGLLKANQIVTIEDACQAVGASKILGVAACYSFYPAKILGCYGDGGAVATNDRTLYLELLLLRNHYKGQWFQYGYNSRLDNLQAAVLNVKLKYLPAAIERRKEIAVMYDKGIKYSAKPDVREVYQDYIISEPGVDKLEAFLNKRGVETMRNGYPFPADLHKGPQTKRYEKYSLRLPIYPEMTDREVRYVIKCVNAFYGK